MHHRITIQILGLLWFLTVSAGVTLAQTKVGPDAKSLDKVVNKAVTYLKSSQDDNGGWSTKKSPGITGIVVTGLLKSGKVTPADPVAAKGLGYIEGLVNPEKGHIAGKGNPRVQLYNYVTCVNVMALVEANRAKKYESVIGNAVKFLKQLQWDDSEGKDRKDPFFGGAGYDSKSRPDLSNTQFFLDALKEAGVSSDDPALKKALVFVSRCQNLPSEDNDLPFADKIKDGSFIYTPTHGGVTKVVDKSDGIPGYGSMTYAGIKSLIYCGVSKDDPRFQKAYEWIKKNYTVERNPGFAKERGEWALYYYYHTMAKALHVMEVDYVVDSKGVKHDWRKDIAEALTAKQNKDGSWAGAGRWLESDPNLATGYALMTLSYCRPKQ